MSNNVLTESDDGEEFDIIEGTPPAEDAQADNADDADDDDDGEDDSDARLADSEDDSEDEITSQNRKRRVKRREIQKRAKENAQRELEMLRHQNAELARRVAAVEGHTLQANEQGIDQRLQQTIAEIRQAESIMARATEAGNGEDVVAAMRIRDEAMSRAQQLQYSKQQMTEARAQQAQPTGDPRVQSYAQEWMQANPWYNPRGGDDDSAVVNAIDAASTLR